MNQKSSQKGKQKESSSSKKTQEEKKSPEHQGLDHNLLSKSEPKDESFISTKNANFNVNDRSDDNQDYIREEYVYQSVIPHPYDLHAYEKVHKGLADRIIQVYEKNSDHEIDIDNKKLQYNYELAKRGQLIALTLAGSGIIGSVLIALFANIWWSIGMFLTTFGSIVGYLFFTHLIGKEKDSSIE